MNHRQQFGQRVKELFDRHGLFELGWEYGYDKYKRSLGTCRYSEKLITFSLPFVDINTVEAMENTILHEIAYALAGFNAGHGPVWKLKAVSIGARPERCNSDMNIKRPVGPYVFLCKCAPVYYYRSEMLYRNMRCRQCKVVNQVVKTSEGNL